MIKIRYQHSVTCVYCEKFLFVENEKLVNRIIKSFNKARNVSSKINDETYFLCFVEKYRKQNKCPVEHIDVSLYKKIKSKKIPKKYLLSLGEDYPKYIESLQEKYKKECIEYDKNLKEDYEKFVKGINKKEKLSACFPKGYEYLYQYVHSDGSYTLAKVNTKPLQPKK